MMAALSQSWIWRVAFTHVRSKKESGFLSFFTWISIAGLALGVASMIIVLSVMDGFESEMKKRMMASELHVLVEPVAGMPVSVSERKQVLESLRNLQGVSNAWPVVPTEVILRSGKKVAGVVLKGTTSKRMQALDEQVTERAQSQLLMEESGSEKIRVPGLILGSELALELGVIPGDKVTLISPTETDGPLSSVPKFKRFVVEAIYKSGLPDQELHVVFTPISNVESFLRRTDLPYEWEVSVVDFDAADTIARRAQSALMQVAPDHFKVRSWSELNAHLFYSLRLERVAMFIIMMFIVIVASFNIVTTLTLMVLEKRKEIAILKTMGSTSKEVGAIFLAEGLIIGTLGVFLGVVFGFLSCLALRRYEFIQLPEIYYDRTLPVTFQPLYYALVVGVAVIIVGFACGYPSRRSAAMDPIEGIRRGA